MTGTLPSIPLAQNIDENGLPQSGCRLFVYEANTSTPVITYKDLLMSTGMEHSWPIVADALGRIPMFFVPDGYYRARLEDRYGTPLYDEAALPALSTGEGGGGPAPPATIQFLTGDFIWQPVNATRTNWVRANGRTIGNVFSGADERANADCANLYAWLWNNFPDAWCPVNTGRGATATLDFEADKAIQLFDMRGFVPGGLDGMGNSSSTRYTGVPVHRGTTDIGGAYIGLNNHTLATAEMPSHNHAAASTSSLSISPNPHSHQYQRASYSFGGGGSGSTAQSEFATQTEAIGLSIVGGISTEVYNMGGGAAHNNIQFTVLGTWFIRL